MRVAILSDIHGNLEALEAVLADARELGYDRLVCLGDIVGYGADPEECVLRIRESAWSDEIGLVVVQGNHDAAVAGGDDRYFNPDARRAVGWTRDNLSPQSIEWLGRLPLEKRFESMYFVHSSPFEPAEWNYVTTMNEAWAAFQYFPEQLGFIGHSHVPFSVSLDADQTRIQVEPDDEIHLHPGSRYLTNVGSVGQPRDSDPRACYIICDDALGLIERRRVEYDIESAAEKIRTAGLPAFLADRLSKGR